MSLAIGIIINIIRINNMTFKELLNVMYFLSSSSSSSSLNIYTKFGLAGKL